MIHTLSSDSPVRDLGLAVDKCLPYGIKADCGKFIDRPTLAFLWDSQAMDSKIDWTPNVCPRCKGRSDALKLRYTYAVAAWRK